MSDFDDSDAFQAVSSPVPLSQRAMGARATPYLDGLNAAQREAVEVLEGVEDISVQRLTHHDVVRHELVQAIVRAYDEHAARAKEEWSDGRYAQERPQMD